MTQSSIEAPSVLMRRMVLLTVQAPTDDVERIMREVATIVPLAMGKYDSNAYQSGAGVERYRPLEGAVAGAETEVRKRPGIVEVSFDLPDDPGTIEQVIETIYQAHSYQEPVIRLQNILTSRTKGIDDSKNPNRWWNTTGDWKAKPEDKFQ